MWATVQLVDEKQTYKFVAHQWIRRKNLPWLMCKTCGLLLLKNAFTKWCDSKDCLNEIHSEFSNARIRYTR